MDITEHFTAYEFRSQWDNIPYPEHWIDERLEPLCKILEVIRHESDDDPIKITSGYRSQANNTRVGGAPNSFHTTGNAVDFHSTVMKTIDLHKLISELIRDGKIPDGGLGYYPRDTDIGGWVHYDRGPAGRRWVG